MSPASARWLRFAERVVPVFLPVLTAAAGGVWAVSMFVAAQHEAADRAAVAQHEAADRAAKQAADAAAAQHEAAEAAAKQAADTAQTPSD
jgi:hypothetical protein